MRSTRPWSRALILIAYMDGCPSNKESLRVTFTDERTGKKTTTRAPCAADRSDGEIVATVPPGAGPWTLTVGSDELATLRSEQVCHITPRCFQRFPSIYVYALGCGDPECQRCVDSRPVGWCE